MARWGRSGRSGGGITVSDFTNATTKTNPVSADTILISDSEDSGAIKKITAGASTVATYSSLPTAASHDDEVYIVLDRGANGVAFKSNGTTWLPLTEEYIVADSSTTIKTITANAAITWTAADNGSGKVRLSSFALDGVTPSAHGLTTSPAVGASLYVTTTQNVWIAGDLHEIASVVSTTVIDLTTTYATHGIPVFALAGDKYTIVTTSLPPLRSNSKVRLDMVGYFEANPGTTNSRRVIWDLSGSELYNYNHNTNGGLSAPFTWGFDNKDSQSVQKALSGKNTTGTSLSSTAANTAAVDTSGATSSTISVLPAAANEVVGIDNYRYTVYI